MKHSVRALALVLSFSACGRLELGSYGREGQSDPTGGESIMAGAGAMGVAPSGGRAASAGQASSVGSGGAWNDGGGTFGQPSTAGAGDGLGGAGTAADAGSNGVAGAGSVGDSAFGGAGIAGDSGVGDAGAAGGGGDGALGGKFRSCRALSDICGGSPQRSCCSVGDVPAGEFIVGGLLDSNTDARPSHVSAFELGEFEVTVGRFRAFLDAYDAWRARGALKAGAGAHPLIPGSGWDPGWLRQPSDSPERAGLDADRVAIEARVTSCLNTPFSTVMWLQPINCVSFYEAQAFCIWDGGRLPTDLEWEYAAAGEDENRIYPWGSAEPTHNHAMYGCSSEPDFLCMIPAVGSYLQGRSRFGQFDLAGSVEEWTLDTLGNARPNPCNDCASVQQIYDANPRVVRGGSWVSAPESLRVAGSSVMEAPLHLPMFGFRCAYDAQ